MSGHSKRFVSLVDEVRPRVREMEAAAVRARLAAAGRGEAEGLHLVDVREESEWSAGRIPGATHIGRGVLERDIEKRIPDADAEIVLYCGGGYRSALAAESLGRMGYARVASMAGGIRGWKEAGYAIEEGGPGEAGAEGKI